jgi:hypothetical protein
VPPTAEYNRGGKKQVEMPPLAILLATGCGQRPEDSLLYRETWEAFVLGPSGLVEATASVSNQGLRRGLATMRVRRVRPDGSLDLAYSPPTRTYEVAEDHGGVRLAEGGLGDDRLGASNWRVQGSEQAPVAFAIQDRVDGATPRAAWLDRGGAFRVEVPIADGRAIGTTWAEATVVSGPALALHRGGDALPRAPRRLVWATGTGISLGYDREGAGALAWLVMDGEHVPADDARITSWTDETVVLEIPSQRVVASFERGPAVADDGPSPLFGERWLWAIAGVPTRRDLRVADARISVDGAHGTAARGLVLEER